MKKRTAMLMAAGVAAALLVGSVALTFGLSGSGTAVADTATRSDPIVRTIHRTVRVDKQAKGSDQPVQVITLSSDTSSSDPTTSHGDDDAIEDGSGDDSYESDDQYESEDHGSSDDDSSDDHESGDDGFGDD